MSRPEISYAFPKPGPGLKAVLGIIGVVGIVSAILSNIGGVAAAFYALACASDPVLHGQVWRLLTAGILTAPDSFQHLLFTLIGLYFLSPDLETRWGTGRFLRFLAWSTIFGFVLAIAVDVVAPPSIAMFHPKMMFGAGAAISATAIAWAQANARAQVRLFFFLPMSGKALFWVTIAFCMVGLIYGGSTEGVIAPFGGVIVALVLAGEPSPLRSLYLRMKLMFLRRGMGSVPTAHEIATGKTRRGRGNRPPLRVVQGGQSDDPPKDKRYLN
jgi:membrane associated rhomboid family serine protease